MKTRLPRLLSLVLAVALVALAMLTLHRSAFACPASLEHCLIVADASTPAPSSTLEPVSTATPVPAPTSIGDDVGLLPTIAKDFAAGGPGTLLAVGLVLLVIVQLLKQYGGSLGIPAAYLPWLAIALGVLAGAGLSLASGAPLVPSLASGLVAGLASVGKYEAIGSKLLPSASDVAAKPAS